MRYLKNKKTNEKELASVSSILIFEKQKEYLKKKNKKLSELVRDLLADLMSKDPL